MNELEKKLLLDKACDEYERRLASGEPCNAVTFAQRHPWLERETQSAAECEQLQQALIQELLAIEVDSCNPNQRDGLLAKYPKWVGLIQRLWDERRSGLLEDSPTVVPSPNNTCRQCGHPLTHQEFSVAGKNCFRNKCQHCGYAFQSVDASVTRDLSTADDLIEGTGEGGGEGGGDLPTLPDRFKLKSIVGFGAFGQVYGAWDEKLRRHVALKIPHRGAFVRELFLREARAASRLKHPNIVRVHDVADTDSTIFIVSELVEGPSLKNWLNNHDPGIDQICRLMIDIGSAVQYAHENQVIHRDLKPGNIVLDAKHNPYLLDFGLSRSRIRSAEDTVMKTGSPIGTPAFMSPEQVRGDRDKIDGRSDVFALGVILFQLLTRKLPFSGDSPEIFDAVLNREPPSLRDYNSKIPRALEAIVLKAVAKRRQDRYDLAGEFVRDLERFVAGEPVSAFRQPDLRVVKARLKKRWAVVVAGLLLVAVAALFLINKRQYDAANPRTWVQVPTMPPGARLTWTRFDPQTGQLDTDNQVTGVGGKSQRLPPGFYQVEAQAGDDYFQVYRTIPESEQQPTHHVPGVLLKHRVWDFNGQVAHLLPVRIRPANELPPDGVFVPPDRLVIAENDARVFFGSHPVQPFLMFDREITQAEFSTAFPQWQGVGGDPGSPVANVNWDMAVAYAELKGLNIPTVYEFARYWEHVNRNLDTQAGLAAPEPGQPIPSLLGGIEEWTATPRPQIELKLPNAESQAAEAVHAGDLNSRAVIKSLDHWDPQQQPPQRLLREFVYFLPVHTTEPRLGFRCIRRLKTD